MNSLAARTARKFLTHACCDSHQARVLEDAQLILTELVANAVRHGAPPIDLEVSSCAGTEALQVRVRDTSPDQPRPRPAATDDENGRGLALVDLLSDAWGIDVDPLGKTVWFRLAVP